MNDLTALRPRPQTWRRLLDKAIKGVSALAALVGCFFLAWILIVVINKGGSALSWSFFTQPTAPAGIPGGMANAIIGTLLITALATVIGVPLGLLAGVYLAEFGRGHKLAYAVHFAANVLMGVPSIIIGIFVYAILVRPMQHFSGYAGAVALAIIMLPIIARTSEDILLMVPSHLREAALALGAPRWKVIFGVLFRAAKVGLLTGVLLSIARVSGETAPLLFTALNDSFWTQTLNAPTANLTVSIFNRAMSPYEDWQQTAWGASLLITVGILALTIICRFLIRQRSR